MSKKPVAPRVDRSAKLAELQAVVARLDGSIQDFAEDLEQRELLVSVTKGLYEETDKLCKKAPAEQVTELLLEQVNHVIGETKELISDDPFVQRLNQFVPAGDRPEHRDVVMVLRQILQALERFKPAVDKLRRETHSSLREARVLLHATQNYQRDGSVLSRSDVDDDFVKDAEAWFVGDQELFDFDDLDARNMMEYFNLEQ